MSEPGMTRIFGWLNHTQPNAVDFIRIVQPLNKLKEQGWEVSYDRIPGWAFRDSDVVIGGRVALPAAAQPWTRFTGMPDGPFMVWETDDDYLGTNRYNPAHAELSTPDLKFGYIASARVSHRLVTSTDYLAELLYEQTGHPDIVVARNTVPDWMIDLPRTIPGDGELVIGWAGGSSHRGDWEWWGDGIRKALVKLPDARFRFIGADYRKILRMTSDRLEWVPWSGDTEDYWRSPALELDIAVAPLRPEPFNRAKSEIKLIEYGARGIPVVANRFGIYEKYIKDGETGILVSSKKEWTAAILELAHDRDLREQMGAQARLQASKHTISARISEYQDAYTP